MIRVAFLFETAPTHRLFESHVRNALRKAAQLTRMKDADVTVVVVGDVRIRKLNTIYRHKRKSTDVLSFAMRDGEAFPVTRKMREQLGDIFINSDEVKRRVKSAHVTEKDLFAFLAVHGFLHLAGFDHQTSAEIRRMRQLEHTICQGKVFYNFT